MWLSDISVRRPVFATVVNALLVVFGTFALLGVPVREYPDVEPPVVSVDTRYPGASAAVVETQITQLIEAQISGIEGIRSMTSSSTDGRSRIRIEFNLSRDVDAAANDVRDRVSRVLRDLPSEADPPRIQKSDSDAQPIMQVVLASERMTALELSEYVDRYMVDRFSAIDGVSLIHIFGERHKSMRVWLDRRRLAAHGLTTIDIEEALARQNVERPAGRLDSSDREFTLRTSRAFATPEDFARLVIARGEDGYPIRLADVALVEVGPVEQRSEFRANGVPAIGLGIIKQSKANTLEVARAVRQEIADLEATLPAGMSIRLNVDNSQFIEASLRAVGKTLIEAGVIVLAVIWLFLGNVRATLIPAATVPISLLTSFIFLTALGFSLNILTMLALVLAIGLVVDDAIVVIENIHRRIELGEPPLLAAYRGAREVGFAVVATTVVLIAVFTPLSLLQGEVGRLFREFALALAAAVACSSVVALTLSPVMAAWLLGTESTGNRLTRGFSRLIDRLALAYHRSLDRIVGHSWISIGIIAVMLAGAGLLFAVLPREVTPPEDRGQFTVQVRAPEGASFDYTARYLAVVEHMLLEDLGRGEVDRMILRLPSSGVTESVSSGVIQVSMTDWQTRHRPTGAYAALLAPRLAELPGVRAVTVERRGFGPRFGRPVEIVLGGGSFAELAQWRDRLFARIAEENPGLERLDSDYEETKPTIAIDIDMNRAADLGVSVQAISRTLETLLGGRRATTFIEGGKEYDVMLQAHVRDRNRPSDLANVYVRSESTGLLIPLSNLITTRDIAGAASYNRFDRMRAITISANLAPGYALGDALEYLERVVAEELPSSARLSYSGQSRELKESSHALYLSFALALVVVFLVLAGQFESWIHPLVIMMTVPLAVFGALAALACFGYTLNIYTQIGIIMLIGLAAKNGILVVEFANQRRDAGVPFREAVLEAARIRLRPILMTSIATAAGVVPLVLSSGAGAEARANLGIVVFWGVLFATLLTLWVVPSFYALLARGAGSPGRTAAQLAEQEAAVL